MTTDDSKLSIRHVPITLEALGISPAAYVFKQIMMFFVAVVIGVLVMVNLQGNDVLSGGIIGVLIVYFGLTVRAIFKAKKNNSGHTQTEIEINKSYINNNGLREKVNDWLLKNGFENVESKDGNELLYIRNETPLMIMECKENADYFVIETSIRDERTGQCFDLGEGIYGALVRPKARKLINQLLLEIGVEGKIL